MAAQTQFLYSTEASQLLGTTHPSPHCPFTHLFPPPLCTYVPCSFILPNRRQDLQVAFVTSAGVLKANTPVITNAAPNSPTGVKVVPETDATKMSVQWQTKNASQPQVVFGTSPAALSTSASANTTTYTKADIISAATQGMLTAATSQMTSVLKGWNDPGSIHKAMLTGLRPNTTYYYQVVDAAASNSSSTSSGVFSFTTPPAPGSSDSFVWLMAADVGQASPDGASTTVAIKPGALGVRAAAASWHEIHNEQPTSRCAYKALAVPVPVPVPVPASVPVQH